MCCDCSWRNSQCSVYVYSYLPQLETERGCVVIVAGETQCSVYVYSYLPQLETDRGCVVIVAGETLNVLCMCTPTFHSLRRSVDVL